MAHAVGEHGSGSRPSTSTSRTLLERVRARDPGGWERLVRLYAPLVWHWCRRWGVPDQDIADLMQDVFGAVAAHVGRFRKEGDAGTFRGWLRRIAQNKARDYFRRRERDARGGGGTDRLAFFAQLPDDEPASVSSADGAEVALVRRALDAVRGDVAPRTWAAFWRTAVEGHAAADVAADLGMTPGAVRVAKSRVLQRLREELGELSD